MITKQQSWRHLADNMERLRGEGPLPPVTVDCAIHDLREAAAALDKVERERDAYKRAKAENDDRFMTERDEARALRDAANILRGLAEVRLAAAEAEIRELKSPKPRAMGVEHIGTNVSYAGESEGEG